MYSVEPTTAKSCPVHIRAYYIIVYDQDVFDKVLQALASPPVLKSDLDKPVTLTMDGSFREVIWGLILTQVRHPITFVSWVLTKTEQRYSNI